MRVLEKISSYGNSKRDTLAILNTSYDEASLTYGQLNDLSDRLAFYLQEKLGSDKTPIVVYGHKNPYMVVLFLACVKSGRAYCPVDISVPLERVKDIIEETATPLIFATENLDLDDRNIVSLEETKTLLANTHDKIDPIHYVGKEDVFYIIFTSGSTGKPKGVQITEDCLYHFVRWAVTLGNKSLEGRSLTFINQAPFSFDLSVMDLYMSLYLGGTLWCLNKSVQGDARALLASLEQSRANIWVSTPSFANMCLASDAFCQEMMPQMELFLFCGETLTNNTAEKLIQRFPRAAVVNTYGPTESTVAMTEIVVTDEVCQKYSPLPVGKVKPGTYVFIVDEDGRLLPEGEKGELMIVGDSVSIGYFHRPDITEKAFSTREIEGVVYRSYKTGDEAYIKDGQVFYCGRIDLQIKLHGYRIEIEDIENNLLKLSCIKGAVVLPVVRDGAIESLAAFVTVDFVPESSLKAAQMIKKQLAEFLPTYMIPKKFVFTDSFPVTNNGKVDRKKLRESL